MSTETFDNINCSDLVGAEVIQVCFGLHQIAIHLSEQASIVFEDRFSLENIMSQVESVDSFNVASLHSLLGTRLLSVEADLPRFLKFVFSNRLTLNLHPDPTGYESYQINYKGKSLII